MKAIPKELLAEIDKTLILLSLEKTKLRLPAPKIVRLIRKLKDAVLIAEAGLEFYADSKTYGPKEKEVILHKPDGTKTRESALGHSPIELDFGNKAQSALQQMSDKLGGKDG